MTVTARNENRRHQRYPVDWTVEIQIGDWHDAQLLTSGNLSQGGLFIRFANRGIEQGMTLRVALRLPDDARVEVEGVVAHVVRPRGSRNAQKVPGFGLCFAEKHAMHLELLQSIAASHADSAQRYHIEAYISLDAEVRRGDHEVGVRTNALAPRRPISRAVPVAPKRTVPVAPKRAAPVAPKAAPEAPTLVSTPDAPIVQASAAPPLGPLDTHEYELHAEQLQAALPTDIPARIDADVPADETASDSRPGG